MVKFSSFLLLLVLSSSSIAIVNIETQRINDHEPGHHGHLNLYLDGRNGTSDKVTYGLSTQIVSAFDDREVIYILDRQFGSANGEVNTDQRFFHLRYFKRTDNLSGYEAFSQYEQDKFRALSSRYLLGGGYRFNRSNVLKGEDSSFNVKPVNIYGIGGFYEEEEINQGTGNEFDNTFRANIYWTYKYPVSKHALFTSSLYYQPSIDEWKDQKGLWQVALKVSVTQKVALNVSAHLNYDTDTPEAVDALESRYFTSIRYDF